MIAKKKLILFVCGICMILIMAAIPFMNVSSEAAPASSEIKTLKIGCSEPLNVPLGVEAKKCLELIVDGFNKSGGLVIKGQRYNIEMIIYDDKYTPEGGKRAAERLIHEDNVKFMVGQLGSPAILGALTVTEPAKVINIFGGVSDKLNAPTFKYAFGGGGVGTLALWPYVAKAYPNAKTLVFVSNDDETGHFNVEMNKKGAKFYGIGTIREFFVPLGTQDFSPIATSVAAANPEIVSCVGTKGGADTGLLIKALRQSGWQKPIVHNVFSEPDVIAVCGKEAAEGYTTLFTDSTQWTNPPPEAPKLRQMYELKYGSWSPLGINWVNPWYLFIAAVQKADSLEADDILAVVRNGLTFKNLLGEAMLIKRPDLGNHRYIAPLNQQGIGRYENGKLVFKDLTSLEEQIKVIESVLGSPGQWR
jgi:branched-chain amino acid transport system substrate-binding protein